MVYPNVTSTGSTHCLEDMLQRHRAFWAMEEVGRPLLRAGRYQPLEPREPFRLTDGSLTQEGARILPELVDARRLIELDPEPSAIANGDFIECVAPYDLCWTEAIVGCPIGWNAGHVWSDSFLDDLNSLKRLPTSPDDRWPSKLLEVTQFLVERAGGRYPVCQPLLRGPVDMAAAVLGDEQLCWAMVDEPQRVRQLLEICTDVFLTVASKQSVASSSFQGGGCEFGIWAPGTIVRTQCDNAALLSPSLYQQFLVPCDERICANFDYPLMHTHACFIEIVADALLGIERLRAIQVSLDYPAGPGVTALLPTFRRINQQKPLIITGGLSQQELNLLLETLSPKGLCLQVSIHD